MWYGARVKIQNLLDSCTVDESKTRSAPNTLFSSNYPSESRQSDAGFKLGLNNLARLARSFPTFQVLGGAKNVKKRELGSSGPRQMDGGDAPSQELAELPLVKLGQVL